MAVKQKLKVKKYLQKKKAGDTMITQTKLKWIPILDLVALPILIPWILVAAVYFKAKEDFVSGKMFVIVVVLFMVIVGAALVWITKLRRPKRLDTP